MSNEGGKLAELMARAHGGDANAYRELLAEIGRRYRPICKAKLAHLGSDEDCLQEILVAVHRARHTYETGKPIEPWLNAIARYKIIDHLRVRTRIACVEVLDDAALNTAASAPAPAQGEELSDDLKRAIEGLDPKYRDVLTLLKIEGLSVKEVAARTGLSDSAVKVRASRAYEKIRRSIEKVLKRKVA